MRDGRSRTQGGSNHCGLDQLRVGCAGLARIAVVNLDAIRALGCERDRDGNQFLVLSRECSFGDGCLVKGPKRLHHFRREAVHFLDLGQVFFVVHVVGLLVRYCL